jgi:spermidine synthase
MGATLPAMNRIGAAWGRAGQDIAALYAANTFGAVLGVLATAFWLVPMIGLTRTATLCAGLNLLCAVAALRLFTAADGRPAAVSSAPASRVLLGRLAATGLLGIGYEVLVVRILSQVSEDTVYTFAMLLAVYLVGTAVGAAVCQRWLQGRDDERLTDRLLTLLAAACLVGTASLWGAQALHDSLLGSEDAGMRTAMAAEAVLALVAFGPATLVMGALFSHLGTLAGRAGVGFGRALGVNTLGAAAAPLLFGVLLTPWLGPKFTLLLIAAGYLALTRRTAWRWMLAPSLATLALALWAPPLAFVELPEGGRIVSYQDGAMAAVSVVEDAAGVARLRINNRQQEGSSATRHVDARQALLPRLLHPSPRHALFLGLGTGVTASAAADDPGLQVDAVELLPEVIAASQTFRAGPPNPRLHLVAADARRWVRTHAERYELIVADNFHPARSGSGALYTVEHFQAVRTRLTADGLFCQWLPLHQLDLATLRSIVHSFTTVYPGAWAILASNSLETPVLGLLARADGGRFDLARLRNGLRDIALPQPAASFGIEDEFALLGSFVAGPRALQRFAAGAPANTDDHPVVAYGAPRITYAPDSLPRDRLLALLDEISVTPDEVLEPSLDVPWAARLAGYWDARHRFLRAGRDVRPTDDLQAMLAQVRGPLMDVLRTSPEFRPAYDPLLRMAVALARQDRRAAQALLSALVQVQPARREAGQALLQIEALPP